MFGETLILGTYEQKLDSKNRLFIPSATKVEKNENLLIQKTMFENELAIKIISATEYLLLIERIKKLRDNSTNLKDFEKYTLEIEKICKKLDLLVKVDNQKRIQIPINLKRKLNWQEQESLELTGFGEYLLVRKK